MKSALSVLCFMLAAVLPALGESPAKGALSPNGKLIIHVIGSGRPVPILLETDYGLMVFNDGDADTPKPRFEVSVRADATIHTFHTVPELAAFLDQLPRGSRLHHYDKCTVSTAYKLPQSVWRELRVACTRRRMIIPLEPRITCYCAE